MKKTLNIKFMVSLISILTLATFMCKPSKDGTAGIEGDKNKSVQTAPFVPGNPRDIENGKLVYNKNACANCHLLDKDQLSSGMGPSIVTISKTYISNGGKTTLVGFFSGDNKSIVAPDKFTMMKASLRRIQDMTDQQKSDLADYLLSY